MRQLLRMGVVGSAVALTAATALGFGDTKQGRAIGDAFRTVAESRGAEGRLGRKIVREFQRLDRVSNERLAARELRAAARAARFVERKLSDEVGLSATFEASVQPYLDDLNEARETLARAAAAESGQLTSPVVRRAGRALKRLDAHLPSASEIATMTPSEALAALARAARYTRGFAAYDGFTAHYVLNTALPPAQPIDHDGDSVPDATTDLSGLGVDLEAIAIQWVTRFQTSPTVTLWNLDSTSSDSFMSAGILTAVGSHLDREEADEQRHPDVRTVDTLVRSSFSFRVQADELSFGYLPVEDVYIQGSTSDVPVGGVPVTATAVFSLTPATVVQLASLEVDYGRLTVEVDAAFVAAVQAAVDHDSDGDNVNDSLTVVLDFEGTQHNGLSFLEE